jgi:hypothetical protein
MAELPSGWVPIGESREWHRLLTLPTSDLRIRYYVAYIALVLGVIVLGRWAFEAVGAVPVLIALGVLVIAVVAMLLYSRSGSPRSEVNLDTDEVRVRGAEVPFSAIVEAVYLSISRRDRVDSFLSLDTVNAPVLTVCLKSSKLPELDAREREIVAEVLRRSNVTIPQSKRSTTNRFYDPAGKFEWMRHPQHLTTEDAIEFVLHTPASGVAWRTPPPKKSIWIDEAD